MIEAFAEWKALIVFGWFVLFFVLERLRAAAPPPASRGRLLNNGALWLISLAIWPIIILPLTMIATQHPLWVRPEWLNGWAGLVATLILMDLWTYWVHRAYHQSPLMWRLHEVHHRDQHLDTTSAVRFHFGEVALSATLRMALIIVLAIPLLHVVVFETLLLAAAIYHHSNLRLPVRLEDALSTVIVTPAIHWVHHHAVRQDTDSNYAAVLSIWDRLFGSKSATTRERAMPIGVEGEKDMGLIGLLVLPVRGRS